MKKTLTYRSALALCLLAASSTSWADTFHVAKISTKRGEISDQPLSVLADKTQAGKSSDSNNWDTYIEVSPNNKSFIGHFKFSVPTDTHWGQLIIHSNTLGAAYDEQQWRFQLRNFSTKKWITIGSNQYAKDWQWLEQAMAVNDNIEDYISDSGRVTLRYRSNNDNDVSDIDYLALELLEQDSEPNPTPTTAPTAIPTAVPTATPTAVPTATPTAVPTATPTAVPTATPTAVPTATPTAVPTATPTAVPTATPTAVPTATPTAVPTATPTAVPTATPTAVPTATPTAVPTVTPTAVPTATPTLEPATAHTITVSPSGLDDYTSIQAALDAVSQVDTTILVKAGTYNEKIEFDTCGSADGYIVIQGEDGAIMSGTSGDAFYLEDCSYVKIRGLEITGYDQGIEVAENSDYITIENNDFHHIGDGKNSLVVYVHGGGTTDPNEQIFILNNEMSYNTTGNSEVVTVNGNVDGFVIQGNYVHHNNNIGIDVIGFEGNGPDGLDQARNGLIADNRVEYISTEGGPGFDRNSTYSKNDYSADGIYVDGGKNIIIERNIVENCDIGIELASEHKGENTENIIVRNNFISNSYQGNITMGGYASSKGNAVNIEIYNNTTYNGNDAEILVQYNSSHVTIKNNIFYAKSGNDYLSDIGSNNTDFTVSNNLYYGASNSNEGSWTDSNPLFANPQLLDVNNLDLHKASNSPAIDAGVSISGNDLLGFPSTGDYDVDGNTRIYGDIDMGADEK